VGAGEGPACRRALALVVLSAIDLRHRLVFRRALEVFSLLEAEVVRDNVRREFLDPRVERQHGVVVGLTRECDLVLGRGQFLLQAKHVFVRTELRIVFHHGEQST